MLLVQALESEVALDKEHMAFLADNGDIITTDQDSQELTTTTIFQTDDLDAFDFDCDEASSASAVLMAKLLAYDSDILSEHDVLSLMDTEETLLLAEESRLKINAKQNDPITKEKKVNIAPIDYSTLNKLYEHFVKNFVPKKQLSVEQAFWLPISKNVSETLDEYDLKMRLEMASAMIS
ncbi:hypothetical protein Tco_0545775 [Tanacetum coccineum]